MAKLTEIEAKEFKSINKKGKIVLLDVSKIEKFESGSIPNSVHVDLSTLKKRENHKKYASTELVNYVTSNNGRLGKKAAKYLQKKKYNVVFIKGGSDAYGRLYPLNRIIKNRQTS